MNMTKTETNVALGGGRETDRALPSASGPFRLELSGYLPDRTCTRCGATRAMSDFVSRGTRQADGTMWVQFKGTCLTCSPAEPLVLRPVGEERLRLNLPGFTWQPRRRHHRTGEPEPCGTPKKAEEMELIDDRSARGAFRPRTNNWVRHDYWTGQLDFGGDDADARRD